MSAHWQELMSHRNQKNEVAVPGARRNDGPRKCLRV